MKVYIKESGDIERITININKEFKDLITEESFKRLLQDYWQLRKLLLCMNSIVDMNTETGMIKTKYGTWVNCFKLSTYVKLFILAFLKHITDTEFIVPYNTIRYNLYTDGLLDWFIMCNTSLYFADIETAKLQIAVLKEYTLIEEVLL